MGTQFYFDEMVPARDPQARDAGGVRRQLEIFRPSGGSTIDLRIGPIGEENSGEGPSVSLDEAAAKRFYEALVHSMRSFGWVVPD